MIGDNLIDARARAKDLCALAVSLVVLAPATVQAAVTISAAATKNMVCASGVCTPTHKSANLNVTDLQNLLATSNTQVTTGSGSLALQTLDIVVAAALRWTNFSVLALDAYRSITINKPVSVGGQGGVVLVTDGGDTGGGELSFGASGNLNFSSLASSLTINGSTYTLVGDVASLASDIAANPTGDFALASSYDAKGDGTYPAAAIPTAFKGHLDGLGNSIKNLTIYDTSVSSSANLGLFAVIGVSAEVRSLGLINVFVRNGRRNGIGALAGDNQGTVARDFTTGRVYGANSSTGGFVGLNSGTIIYSHSTAAVRCSGDACTAGGLVGYNLGGLIAMSYASGSTISGGNSGGLVGASGGTSSGQILNSYATGAMQANDSKSRAGGLVGTDDRVISGAYSTGTVTGAAGSTLGGFVGDDGSSSGSTGAAYWDTTTSGITDLSQGAGNRSNDPGVSGLSTTQLQAGLPTDFSPLAWGEDSAINGGLPYLLANPPP